MDRSRAFQEGLLAWHDLENKRDMPWKSERDPYKIWLSEIILQQTRVDQGTSYYLKFVDRFPSVHELAKVSQDKVLQMWEGLGYYSRARNLHETAKYISEKKGGKFPASYKGLLSLKGVGPYTAAAIGSFAFNLPTPVVDGNSLRLVMRFEGNDTPINDSSGKKDVYEFLSKAIPHDRPADFNQALMDFGATVCKPKNALCHQCPLQNRCKAYERNVVHKLPVKRKGKPKRHRYFHYFLVRSEQDLLIEKRELDDIWQGLYQFPMLETLDEKPPSVMDIGSFIHLKTDTFKAERLSYHTQTLSHLYVHAYFYSIDIHQGSSQPPNGIWVSEEKLGNYGLPKVIRNFLANKQGTLF
ncbi:MAG: A/G-specific adenine glycosylase [Bacteroidetes bacterium]|jgi:A/G-specific adenine glycosylase|nr:A/G-specific adenine glycosylase [Bacteroidota bacterium]